MLLKVETNRQPPRPNHANGARVKLAFALRHPPLLAIKVHCRPKKRPRIEIQSREQAPRPFQTGLYCIRVRVEGVSNEEDHFDATRRVLKDQRTLQLPQEPRRR